jgi:integrase
MSASASSPSDERPLAHLAKAVDQVDERLDKEEKLPLPARLTPHSLRRTFASLLFRLGHTAPEVMD